MGRKPKWTETTILQAFQNYYDENGILPVVKEIDRNPSLPFRKSIKIIMNMNVSELYDTYFADYQQNIYSGKSKEFWTENFIKQYSLLEYPSEDIYNKFRPKGCPNTQAIRKWNGNLTWIELLKKFDLLEKRENKIPLKVHFVFTNEKSFDKLKSELEEILKE